MRILFAVAVLVTIPGIVLAYLGFQASIPPPAPPVAIVQQAAGRFDLELTLTFDVAVDEFDLERRSLVVKLGPELLLESQESIKAGKPFILRDVQGVTAGKNTFFVKAGVAEAPAEPADEFGGGFSLDEPAEAEPPAGEAPALYRAMRVRVLRDGAPIATETIWSEPGAAVEGVFELDVPENAIPSTENAGEAEPA